MKYIRDARNRLICFNHIVSLELLEETERSYPRIEAVDVSGRCYTIYFSQNVEEVKAVYDELLMWILDDNEESSIFNIIKCAGELGRNCNAV